MKKIVDERQEMELMQVERLGFWILYAAVAVDIMTKIMFLGISPKDLLGETGAFILGSLVIIIGCTRRGLWTYHSTPTVKEHLLYSTVFSIVFSMVFYVAVSAKMGKYAIPATFAFLVFIFILLFFTLLLMGRYVLKRQEKLDREYEAKE